MIGSNKPTETKQELRRSWPDLQQGLLLRASLLPWSQALEAWQQWQSQVDIEHIDEASVRLLPLVYHNLHAHAQGPLMNKAKGVYRLTWYQNQMSLHTLALVLRALEQAGIRTMIVKGMALTQLYYKRLGLRPMADLDVLVPTLQASAAIRVLTEVGWKPEWGSVGGLTEPVFSAKHGHTFLDADGRKFDLHWHLLPECCYPGADDDFWSRALPVEVSPVSTLALNPTHQFLHVCVNGARWETPLPIRWLADAMTILNTVPEQLNWSDLLAQAQKRHLVLAVRDMLHDLHDTLDAPISMLLHQVDAVPVSALERREHRIRIRPRRLIGGFPLLWFRYERALLSAGRSRQWSDLWGFVRFMQHRWAVDHLWKLPFLLAAKTLLAIKTAVRRRWSRG